MNRPSKKQKELLSFIDGFIKGNGYGPSYREVMRALEYKSVSTVATHIDGLIQKGFLRKKDNSARSLEVVSSVLDTPAAPARTSPIPDDVRDKLLEAISTRAEGDEERVILVRAFHILGYKLSEAQAHETEKSA